MRNNMSKQEQKPKYNKEAPVLDDDHDIAVQDVMDQDPDTFLAEATLKMRDLPIAGRRRIAKAAAIEASMMADIASVNNNRYDAKRWSNIAWNLRKLR